MTTVVNDHINNLTLEERSNETHDGACSRTPWEQREPVKRMAVRGSAQSWFYGNMPPLMTLTVVRLVLRSPDTLVKAKKRVLYRTNLLPMK